MRWRDQLRIVDHIILWLILVVLLLIALSLGGCVKKVHVAATSPESYHLSICMQDFMEKMQALGKLPHCVARDSVFITNLNLGLDARKKLEGN